MSYNYNKIVASISATRRLAAEGEGDEKINYLQQAVDQFSDLSTKCPMTPLLWMQYSADTGELLETVTQDTSSALETKLQLLELALAEFPGSAILHVHLLELLCNNQKEEKIRKALDNAIENVGKGSHRNEGELIAKIYRLDAKFRSKKDMSDAIKSFYQRARIPMKDVNESLNNEFQQFCLDHGKSAEPEELHGIEKSRRFESKIFHPLVTCEDEIDVAMHGEGILPRHQINLEVLDWEKILKSDEKTCWMGLGGFESTNAFIQYARACYRYRHPQNSDDDDDDTKEIEDTIKGLGPCVYERGIAECPTSESLWLSYIRHLHFLVKNYDTFSSRLKSVVDRAVRNCPYSLPLFQQKLKLHLVMANMGKAVMDPDDLTKTVQEALDGKFITSPEACLELHMTAIQIVRRRILSLLAISQDPDASKAYDDVEKVQTLAASPPVAEMNESNGQEVADLCDDIRDMYDTVDTYLRKHHSAWSAGRVRLWSDRSFTEIHLLGPLVNLFNNPAANSGPSKQLAESIRCHDKLTKVYQPPHPDTYISYIRAFLASFFSKAPSSVLSKIRQVRCLYQKALKSVGKPKNPPSLLDPMIERDFETALRCLCHDYLVFERYFGSDESLAKVSKDIEKKLAKAFENTSSDALVNGNANDQQAEVPVAEANGDAPVNGNANDQQAEVPVAEANESGPGKEDRRGGKRSADTRDGGQPAKKAKLMNSDSSEKDAAAEDIELREDANPAAPPNHRVKVGKLSYPAHPFTIRVSFLRVDTEDMDLVDAFRDRCGAIVHARIVREKHNHGRGKSKGWGLVQFEQQESVEKALELSQVIGIREKLVTVERSHMPAVGLIPPGMHRVSPKGEGKFSKRNQKLKEQGSVAAPAAPGHLSPSKEVKSNSKNEDQANSQSRTSGAGVLAFRPRGVRQNQKHRKVHLALKDD